MSIDGIRHSAVSPGQTRPTKDADRPGGRDSSGANQPLSERSDTVQISSAGRELAAGALGAERIEELRDRIRSGVYDRPAVAEDVARRILASGDVI